MLLLPKFDLDSQALQDSAGDAPTLLVRDDLDHPIQYTTMLNSQRAASSRLASTSAPQALVRHRAPRSRIFRATAVSSNEPRLIVTPLDPELEGTEGPAFSSQEVDMKAFATETFQRAWVSAWSSIARQLVSSINLWPGSGSGRRQAPAPSPARPIACLARRALHLLLHAPVRCYRACRYSSAAPPRLLCCSRITKGRNAACRNAARHIACQVGALELDTLTPDLPVLLAEMGAKYDPEKLAHVLSSRPGELAARSIKVRGGSPASPRRQPQPSPRGAAAAQPAQPASEGGGGAKPRRARLPARSPQLAPPRASHPARPPWLAGGGRAWGFHHAAAGRRGQRAA